MVCRALTDKLDGNTLGMISKKMFQTVKDSHLEFKVGETLQGIIMDWSDAERKAMADAVGERTAEKVCKGCKVCSCTTKTSL